MISSSALPSETSAVLNLFNYCMEQSEDLILCILIIIVRRFSNKNINVSYFSLHLVFLIAL